jgi:hypothetical protein
MQKRGLECGRATTRSFSGTASPATDATKLPKPAWAVPGTHASSREPSPGPWSRSLFQAATYFRTAEWEPGCPFSATALSKILLAVCRCFPVAARSPSGIASIHPAVPSVAGCALLWAIGGFGDMSSLSACLATVFRLRWGSRAIWALGTPSPSIRLTSPCSSRDTVMLPSSLWAGLANGLRQKENIVLAVPLTRRGTAILLPICLILPGHHAQFPVTICVTS